MRTRTATAVTILLATGLTLTGCSASAPDPSKISGAQKLADLDGDAHPTADYQRILDALGPKCTQSPDALAALVYGTQKVMHDDGVPDETNYDVLTHLNQSVPENEPASDCKDVAAAYVTLRESGSS